MFCAMLRLALRSINRLLHRSLPSPVLSLTSPFIPYLVSRFIPPFYMGTKVEGWRARQSAPSALSPLILRENTTVKAALIAAFKLAGDEERRGYGEQIGRAHV